MLTKKQSELLDGISDTTKRGAPHLSELAECMSDAFGGPRALAETLRDLATNPKMPDWLRTRAYGMVINTVSAASKLEGDETDEDLSLLSNADIERELARLIRKTLGVNDEMDADLAAVVAAWPELSEAAKAAIVATVKDEVGEPANSPAAGDLGKLQNDLEAPDAIEAA